MAIREGKWKCPSCSTVNRGAQMQCEQCGTTRDEKVKFFLDEDAPEVTDEAQLAAAKAGADWVCEFCGNTSPQASAKCTGCGAPKTEKQRKSGDVTPTAQAAPPPPEPAPAPAPQQKGCGPVGIAIGLVLLFSCVFFAWWSFHSQHEVATVSDARWQRSVEVEDFGPEKDSAWDRPPDGAYDTTHKTEQRGTRTIQRGTRTEHYKEKTQTGTKKIKTGSKDLGNGHFEDVYKEEPIYSEVEKTREVPNMVEEPVFGEKYYFTIDRWHVVRTALAKGGLPAEAPKWPETKLKGKEREGKKTELYLLTFKSPKAGVKTLKAPNQAEWEKFKPGSEWKVEFDNSDNYKVLGSDQKPTPLEKTSETIG
jgi:hypothetical protein